MAITRRTYLLALTLMAGVLLAFAGVASATALYTLKLLDSRQRVFTNAQLVKLAETLKLDTSPPPAQRTQGATTTAQ